MFFDLIKLLSTVILLNLESIPFNNKIPSKKYSKLIFSLKLLFLILSIKTLELIGISIFSYILPLISIFFTVRKYILSENLIK